MSKLTAARVVAATTNETEIDAGTPEEAYQAVNRAKMLWGFRLRDVDSWREVIERWNHAPKAWHRIPETGTPYGSPRRMIEVELEADYDQFKAFIRAVLGEAYVALIDEPYQNGSGAPKGNQNAAKNNRNTRTDCLTVKRGNSTAYLRQEILKQQPEVLQEIGKGKTYRTVTEAARKLGIRADRKRLAIYVDDPEAAGVYLAERVDREWFERCMDAFFKALG